MRGNPIEKVKEAMLYALENLNPLDNFQIVSFSSSAEAFSRRPVPATPTYLERALEYVEGLSGAGGTIMLEGVEKALSFPDLIHLSTPSLVTAQYWATSEVVKKRRP